LFEAEQIMTAPRSPEKPRLRILSVAFAAAAVVCIDGTVLAQSLPDIENGRYALSPVGDGVVRLDTRTGSVSTCNNSGAGWACYVVPDERAAMDAEIGRLQAENEKLKTDLAAREPTVAGKIDEPLPKQDSMKAPAPKADAERKIEIPLPSDQDVDRVMAFLERAWRRLVEIAGRMQKALSSGKI